MFDHIGFNVSDFPRSFAFWKAALAPLGYGVLTENAQMAMLGNRDGRIWIGAMGPAASPIHVALKAKTRGEVDAFHAAALAAGGRDNGRPGLRPNYAPDYYGAFVFDPDGHNLEAVTHAPA